MDFTSTKEVKENEDICPTAIMQSPKAHVTVLAAPPRSCKPLITAGKIKLYAIKATFECFLTVKNAKIWTPTTTQSPATQASPASEAKGTKDKASNATLIGAIVGVILFILLIGIIAFVVWYFCIRKQNKTVDKKKINAETPKNTAEADTVIDKTKDKQEHAKPKMTTEDTNEKKKAVEKEKASKPKKKEEKAVQRIQLKPSKEFTQENVAKEVPSKKQASVKLTWMIQLLVLQLLHKKINNHMYLFQKLLFIHHHYNLLQKVFHSIQGVQVEKVHFLDGMKLEFKQWLKSHLKHLNVVLSIQLMMQQKLEKFYPPGSARPLEKREIMLFCCTKMSVMFKSIELLIDIAIERLAEHGAKFGDNETVVELSAEGERYVQRSTTSEYVRSFAFGSIFRELIDSEAEIHESCPIPLLFVIVLQRRYSVLNRRKAFTWIRRQMPIIFAEFSLKERKKLSYPITAIEQAYNMDPDGFKNIAALDTESGMEEEPTQDSVTRPSKKNRKKESAGKKKRSKKRR